MLLDLKGDSSASRVIKSIKCVVYYSMAWHIVWYDMTCALVWYDIRFSILLVSYDTLFVIV